MPEGVYMLGNTEEKFGLVGRGLHNLSALLVLVLIGHGWWMVTFAAREMRVTHYTWHASIGYALLALVVIRLLWRWTHTVPPVLAGSAPWERWAAHLGHWGLYALMLATSVLGWGLAGTFRTPLDAKLLGIIPMPAIASADMHGQLEEMHEIAAWSLAALIVVHVAAALYHHFIRHDNILRRMY